MCMVKHLLKSICKLHLIKKNCVDTSFGKNIEIFAKFDLNSNLP